MNTIKIKSVKGVEVAVDPETLKWECDHTNDREYDVEEHEGSLRLVEIDTGYHEVHADATAEVDGHEVCVSTDGDGYEVLVDSYEAHVDGDDDLLIEAACAAGLRDEEAYLEPDKDAQRDAILDFLATLPDGVAWRIDRKRGFSNEWTLHYGIGEFGEGLEEVSSDEVEGYLVDALCGVDGDDNYRGVCHDDTPRYTYSVQINGEETDNDRTEDEAVAEATEHKAMGDEVYILRYYTTMTWDGQLATNGTALVDATNELLAEEA